MKLIHNTGQAQGIILNPEASFSLVLDTPYREGKVPITREKLEYFQQYLDIASIHVLVPETNWGHTPKGAERKQPPLQLLRKGWQRVKRELLLTESVRVLWVTDADFCLFPKFKKGLQDIHGTLFLDSGRIIVPTWKNYPSYAEKWHKRDIIRCAKLVRPEEPLKYTNTLPSVRYYDRLVIDIETSGLEADRDYITTIALQYGPDDRVLIGQEQVAEAINWLIRVAREGSHFYFHNAQFDLSFFPPEFYLGANIHCNMIRARARGELVNSLKHLGNYYTNRPGNYAWLTSEHNFDDPAYVCEDIETTWQLVDKFQSQEPIINLMERAVVMAAHQTHRGTTIDVDFLEGISENSHSLVSNLEKELSEKYQCNINSDEQLIPNLTEMGYRLTKKTPKGNIALDKQVLGELGLDDILEFRKLQKLDSSFISRIKNLLRPNGTLPHVQTIMGARTGRSSMKDFNWQQAGKRGPVRRLLVPTYKNGKIFNIDLSAAELHVAAYISNDWAFAQLLMREDAHRFNAAMANKIKLEEVTKPLRSDAKITVFRTIYGGMPITEGQKIVHKYMYEAYPELMRYLNKLKKFSETNLYSKDFYGKIHNLQEVAEYKGKWAAGRVGMNDPIQGLSSHIAFEITLYCWEQFIKEQLFSRVLFGVHDSVVFDVHPQEIERCKEIAREAFLHLNNTKVAELPLFRKLPMKGELLIGSNWAACEEENVEYFNLEYKEVLSSAKNT